MRDPVCGQKNLGGHIGSDILTGMRIDPKTVEIVFFKLVVYFEFFKLCWAVRLFTRRYKMLATFGFIVCWYVAFQRDSSKVYRAESIRTQTPAEQGKQ